MSYDICLIGKNNAQFSLYLFDTTIWLRILQTPIAEERERDSKYRAFFEEFKIHQGKKKVVLTTLVVSEIINRWLRDYGLSRFLRENPEENRRFQEGGLQFKKEYFKSTYRQNSHYQGTYSWITSELLNYEHLCACVSDDFGSGITMKQALEMQSSRLDFNDNYFVLLARQYKLPIVTDDADFFIDNVTVLTYNNRLYEKGKSAVRPVVGKSIEEIKREIKESKDNN